MMSMEITSAGRARCATVAEQALRRHIACHPLMHYAGIVSMHGALRLAETASSNALLAEAACMLRPFLNGEIGRVGGYFDKMYRCGGNAAAWFALIHGDPQAKAAVIAHAEELISTHPRNKDGAFGVPDSPEKIWIDTVFAVCPFLVYAGRLSGRQEFYDEACRQLFLLDAALRDKETGLYRQCLNFAGPGRLSGDSWSRGNGWAALGIAEMAAEMPASHPQSTQVRELLASHAAACLKFQDSNGLWHQDMTDSSSYAETSGTCLLLHAIGRGLEKGLLPASFRESFARGIRGCLGYIALDGSVFNACTACLCPGDGSAAAYKERPWKLNDEHAFGPVVLAFSQALALGIEEINL